MLDSTPSAGKTVEDCPNVGAKLINMKKVKSKILFRGIASIGMILSIVTFWLAVYLNLEALYIPIGFMLVYAWLCYETYKP